MPTLPFKIAVLCYLYDGDGHVLMLHRNKEPNRGMYSPIGGKLEIDDGEAPHDCARREIEEEAGLRVEVERLHLAGIVSETAYEGQTHWLIFLFEVLGPVRHEQIAGPEIDEGRLEWVPPEAIPDLDIPQTDRQIMWPLVREHRGGFFVVHIDCRDGGLRWEVRESRSPSGE